ncbi:succinate dehydrogenase [Rhizobium cremeum]|uniref:succinate dehydrogenase n=1 Tax=Rhizobium cremeum TaxID=2813827 RepID=UPI000DE0DD8B
MTKPLFLAVITSALLVSSHAMSAERYKLRAPGGVTAATSNEVGVWKTARAAKSAHGSLVIGNQFMSEDLACIVRPGAKAEVLERSGTVALVRASNSMLGGCKGYVKTDFLSAN